MMRNRHENSSGSSNGVKAVNGHRADVGVNGTSSSSSSNSKRKSKGSTWLSYLVIFGITFCVVNLCYVFQYLRHSNTAKITKVTTKIEDEQDEQEEIMQQQQHERLRQQQEQSDKQESYSALSSSYSASKDTDKKDAAAAAITTEKQNLRQEAIDKMEAWKQQQAEKRENERLHIADEKEEEDDEDGIPIQELIDEDLRDHNGSKFKILEIIQDAGFRKLDRETLESLPTWKDVTDLYGDEPKLYGLPEQCDQFQNFNGDKADHFVSVAGTFNTGTNLMSELLINNCHMPARMKKYGGQNRGIRWQVNWGKHTPPEDEEFRKTHKVYKDDMDANKILPAVTIRDPYVWLQSMCRHPYTAKWKHNRNHCPNLVPNHFDLGAFPELIDFIDGGIPVKVTYNGFFKGHTSIVHMYNEYYHAYLDNGNAFNRIFVRYEDLLFHTQNVTRQVCECAGGEMNIDKKQKKFAYIQESAKRGKNAHGPMSARIGFIKALINYGSAKQRYNGYTADDIRYIVDHVDPKLMEMFGYIHPTDIHSVVVKK